MCMHLRHLQVTGAMHAYGILAFIFTRFLQESAIPSLVLQDHGSYLGHNVSMPLWQSTSYRSCNSYTIINLHGRVHHCVL